MFLRTMFLAKEGDEGGGSALVEDPNNPGFTKDGKAIQPPPKKPDPPPPEEPEEVDTDLITKDEATGEYVFKDPANPEGSVYRDKTMKGLLTKVNDAIKEKDTTIAGLKKTQEDEEEEAPADEEPISVEYPTRQSIQTEVLASFPNLKPEMLAWGDDELTAFEKDHSGVSAVRLLTNIENANRMIEETFQERTIEAINKQSLLEETRQVERLVKKYAIKKDEFNYRRVLETVHKNQGNFRRNGSRIGGTIVEAASDVIAEIVRKRGSEEGANTREKDIKEGRRKIDELPSGPTGGARHLPGNHKIPVAKTFDDAIAAISKTMK
jgi:hypothetical protein